MNTSKLATAVRELKKRVSNVIDDLDPDIAAGTDDLRDAKDLLGVLALIVAGTPIDRAFGAPGDWGYSTQIGSALAARGDDYHPHLDGPAEPVGLAMELE